MSNLQKWFLNTVIRSVFLIIGFMILGIACQKKNTKPIIPAVNPFLSPNTENTSKPADLPPVLELKSLIPTSKSTLIKLLPDKVGEYLKTRTLTGHKEPLNISAIQGTYQHWSETSKTILIDIMDGAGPVASVLLLGSIQKLDLDFEEVKPYGFSRILERKCQRVWEAENSIDGVAELEFIHAGRFLVSIKGKQLRHDDLWDFADKLDLKGLK